MCMDVRVDVYEKVCSVVDSRVLVWVGVSWGGILLFDIFCWSRFWVRMAVALFVYSHSNKIVEWQSSDLNFLNFNHHLALRQSKAIVNNVIIVTAQVLAPWRTRLHLTIPTPNRQISCIMTSAHIPLLTSIDKLAWYHLCWQLCKCVVPSANSHLCANSLIWRYIPVIVMNLYLKLAVLKSQIQSKLMTDQYCVGFYDRAPNISGVLNLYTVLFVQNCMRECKKQKY